ncbi:MAG: small multi-drug export protein [Clostridia bacterium]|jgi:uncharacterized membrane protein|nr:small multi-drug export protein [Clostridia bacterium]MCI2015270.1 small multi-drug export protein [Clostridia bacterium]
MQSIIDFFLSVLSGKVSKDMIVFIVSLFPIVELRGGIITGYALNLSLFRSFIIAYIGNLLPIPIILLLIHHIFRFLKKTRYRKIVDFFENKAMKKSGQVQKYGYWGLFLFVAIPLPGTGAWTGALVANLLGLDFKKSMLTIAAGVFAAGVIVSIFSFGLLNMIGIG